jgi:hypothetical protein
VAGGRDAEMEVRRKYYENIEAENKRTFEEYGALEIEAAEKRKEIKRRIEENRDEERQKVAEERKKLLMGQFSKVENLLEELEIKEKTLNEPIDESKLIQCSLKPGKVTYDSGDYDRFGHKVEAVRQENTLKELSELPFEELEEWLISCEFDFTKVWDVVSSEFNCTPDSIRNHWFEYTSALEKYNEME